MFSSSRRRNSASTESMRVFPHEVYFRKRSGSILFALSKMYLQSRNQYTMFQYNMYHFSVFWLTVRRGIAEWKWKQILNQHFYANKYPKTLLKGFLVNFYFDTSILSSFCLYISRCINMYHGIKQEKKVQLKTK